MPVYKIFNPTTGKYELMNSQQIRQRQKAADEWFRGSIKDQFGKDTFSGTANQSALQRNNNSARRMANQNSMMGDPEFKKYLKQTRKPLPGRLYMYMYDPKHKATLPYYDIFPMTFIIDFYDDGFLGLNTHYLPAVGGKFTRNDLYQFLVKYTKETRTGGEPDEYLDFNYTKLRGFSKFKSAKVVIKRYLYSHIRSPLIHVMRPAWANAISMSTQQFKKKSSAAIYMDMEKGK